MPTTSADTRRTIENPLIGDRVTFLKTKIETDGQYELVEVLLQPGGGNPLHYHSTFSESFEAVEGELYVDCDGKTIAVQPGQTVTAPINAVHRFYNPGTRPILFRVKIEPARQFESFLRIAYGLSRDSKIGKNGIPRNLGHAAVFFKYGETYMPNAPLWIQTSLFRFLFVFAKIFGVERSLRKQYLS